MGVRDREWYRCLRGVKPERLRPPPCLYDAGNGRDRSSADGWRKNGSITKNAVTRAKMVRSARGLRQCDGVKNADFLVRSTSKMMHFCVHTQKIGY